MGTNTTNLSLYKPATDETGWSSNVNGNFDTLDKRVPTQETTNTVTATGGASPAVDTTITGVSTDQTAQLLGVVVHVDSDPAWNADYAYNYDWGVVWDDSDSELDVNLTVNWDTDPGGGNDLTLRYRILEVHL